MYTLQTQKERRKNPAKYGVTEEKVSVKKKKRYNDAFQKVREEYRLYIYMQKTRGMKFKKKKKKRQRESYCLLSLSSLRIVALSTTFFGKIFLYKCAHHLLYCCLD